MMAAAAGNTGVREALDAGDSRGALFCLRSHCRERGLQEHPEALGEAMGFLAELAPLLEDPELARLASAVRDSPSDVPALQDLGCALDDRGLFELASMVLSRANGLAPSRASILSELAVALEEECRSDLSVVALESAGEVLDSSFICRYLLAYNAVLAGELLTARAMAAAQLPLNDAEAQMANVVWRMIDRAETALGVTALDDHDLRGWHFVTTGGIILHLSPYGFDDGMRGRYGFTTDTYERIRYCLARLLGALRELGWRPERVMAPDDPESMAIAMAAARMFKLPLERLDDGPGLVVVYDLARLGDDALHRLSFRNPGQILYAHATCSSGPSYAPDLTGYLYHANAAPWEPRTSRRLEKGMAGSLADNIVGARLSWNTPPAPRDENGDLLGLCFAARELFAHAAAGERPCIPCGGGPVGSGRV